MVTKIASNLAKLYLIYFFSGVLKLFPLPFLKFSCKKQGVTTALLKSFSNYESVWSHGSKKKVNWTVLLLQMMVFIHLKVKNNLKIAKIPFSGNGATIRTSETVRKIL